LSCSDLYALNRAYLKQAGIAVPATTKAVEISPLLSYRGENLDGPAIAVRIAGVGCDGRGALHY
jgi:hypothetical protein